MTESSDIVEPGEQIGPYKVLRGFRGHGGMARVYEAEVREKYWQPGMPRRLALKVADQTHQAALVAEADYLSRFNHPNVVRIFPLPGYHRPVYAAKERFTFGWRWYYAMELLEGGSLESTLTRPSRITDAFRTPATSERPLALVMLLGIARQLVDALSHIHACSVLNLDIKPGNILFRRQRLGSLRSSVPRAVLSDFGIARDKRIPRFGELGVATPEYVSPEHAIEIHGGYATLDERSDIFSLGVVLYEMLTGQLPFENIGLIMSPVYEPVPPGQLRPGIPPTLEQVILRALSKDPAARYQTALALRQALDDVGTFVDWGMIARRVFLGVTLTAAATFGGYKLFNSEQPSVPTPQIVVPESSATSPATLPPPSLRSQEGGKTSTSTPRPTFTPTPTLQPVTPIITPTFTPSLQSDSGG